MKQELPIAVALLAGGCLLWFSQSSKPTRKADAGNALPRSSTHASRIPEYMSEFVANQRKRVTASEIEGASDFNLSNEVAPASYHVSAIATARKRFFWHRG